MLVQIGGCTGLAEATIHCRPYILSSWRCVLTLADTGRAGKDASRSFITGCFREHQTHDLRGLSADDLQVSLAPPPCGFP